MTRRHDLAIGACFATAIVVLAVAQHLLGNVAEAQSKGGVNAPRFEVDPLWPKPLPNNWVLGQTIGLGIDARDHVWIVHRVDSLSAVEAAADQRPPTGTCCSKAPPVLEFDPAGNVVGHWGGPGEGYEWPLSNHGIFVDYKDNVWIGGNDAKDAHVLKFTRSGKLLMQIGRQGKSGGSNDLQNFGRVAKIFVDPKSNEAYIADGYGNKRVVVIDMDTGKFKRFWGAYGNKPDDAAAAAAPRYTPGSTPSQQFRGPVHCADPSNDGFIYVCDRTSDRLQVFTRDGKFVKEVFVEPESLGDGSTWDTAFSKDAQQKYLYVADGRNQKLHIYDRASMTELTNFGEGGHYPGQFYSMHSIAVDSKGNLYTTETYQGRRVQRFVYKGLAPVTKKIQGTVWPTTNGSR
jgi:DNA-binding beta-propeller fold protein YncE